MVHALFKQSDILLLLGILIVKNYWFAREIGMDFSAQPYHMLIIGSTMVVVSFLFFFQGKVKIAMVALVELGSSVLLFADLLYYRFFGEFISVIILKQSGQVGDIKEDIGKLIQWGDIYLFVTFPLVLVCSIFLWKRREETEEKKPFMRKTLLFLIVASIGLILYSVPIKNLIDRYGTHVWVKGYSNAALYRVMGHTGYHVYDIYKYIKSDIFVRKEATEEELATVYEWYEEKESGKRKSEFAHLKVSEENNLFILQWESLQSFVIGKTINGQEITPNLNKLIGESVYFENIYDQAGQGRTSDAELMVNTSLHPYGAGSAHVNFPQNRYETLANIMDKTHDAYSFHGNEQAFWNRYIIHPAMGFDVFYSLERLKDTERVGPYLSDKALFNQTYDILAGKKEPFYAFVVAVSSHSPFYIPNGYPFDVGEYQGTEIGRYMKSIHYVDSRLGVLLERMKESGMYDETTFVLYGDHNAHVLFGKDEAASYLGLESKGHEMRMEDKKIPLVIHLPKQKEALKVDKTGSLMDVGPTLLDLYGKESKWMMGTSLLDDQIGEAVFRNGDAVDEQHFLYTEELTGEKVCYVLDEEEETKEDECQSLSEKAQARLDASDLMIRFGLMEKLK